MYNIHNMNSAYNSQGNNVTKWSYFSFQAESVKYAKYHKKGYCVWYGQCTNGTRAKNCFYNGKAKQLNDTEGKKVLEHTCAEMRDQHTCCDTKQLKALATNLQIMKQLTSRCPACWNNMRRFYCEMTCSQDQSLFMDPKTLTNKNTTITDIYYYVSETFKQGLYDSCKDVPFPGNNGKVMKFICGRPERLCSPQILLNFMGSYENGYAPFNIEFPRNLTPDLHWMNKTVFKCNESFFDVQRNRSATPCSCQDCTATCPALPPLPPKPSPHKIAGLDLLSFCLLVTFLTFLVIYIPTSIFCSLLKSRKFASEPAVNNTPFQEVYNPGICERLGSKLESALRHWFTCWGIWCSSHPLLVVGACFVVVGGLSCGLFFFTVTTDPVQLWSSPNSEARRQKDVYDSKFNPFFRTEQLIIRSTHPDSTGYHSYPYGTWVPFGPIFHLDLLNQVMESSFAVLNKCRKHQLISNTFLTL